MPNPDLFDTLFQLGSQVCAAPAEVIFKEGEAADGAYLLTSGRVGLSFVTEDGDSLRLHTASRGTILGLASAITRSPHVFTAATLEATAMSFIPCDELNNLLRDHPTLGLDIVVHLSKEAAAMRRRWSILVRNQSMSDS